mgnify:CR=1 FL=1
MSRTVGVLALQGDFQKHLDSIRACGYQGKQVRVIEDLKNCERLIIPGGESTTIEILIRRHGLDEAIIERTKAGMPVWGTCMGLILLAKEVEGREQWGFRLMNVRVLRNAYGPQAHSFETEIEVKGFDKPFHAVFIRAPKITQLGTDVEVLSEFQNDAIAVRQGNLLGTSFHPELTNDVRFHEYFMKIS